MDPQAGSQNVALMYDLLEAARLPAKSKRWDEVRAKWDAALSAYHGELTLRTYTRRRFRPLLVGV